MRGIDGQMLMRIPWLRAVFIFLFVFGILLFGLVLIRDIEPRGIAVVFVLAVIATVWFVRSQPPRRDDPPASGGRSDDNSDDEPDIPYDPGRR